MSEAQTWKERSLKILKSYYIGFAGTQWHEFDRSKDVDLIRSKIAFAMFGPPSEDAEDIQHAYSKEQREEARKIMDLIFEAIKDSSAATLRIGFVCVSCKDETNEFALPVFSVYVGSDNRGNDKRKFVGTEGRTYSSWNDWKKNNCLPKMQYAYPKQGYFTCSDGCYDFDPQQDPIIEFGESPQSSTKSDVLKGMDIAASVVSVGAGAVGIAAVSWPLAPILLTAAAVAGTSTAVYGASRGVYALIDKKTHGQSLTDLESLTIWLSIFATPLNLAASSANAVLALGAKQGHTFSSTMRMFATAVNFMVFGTDTALLGFGLANLITKLNNDELTKLDKLQFCVSIFFFTNTLIQPKVASQVIRKAQAMHLDRVSRSMTDAQTKQAFEKFMQENQAGGSITQTSKIIRTVNRLEDPNLFFKAVGADAKVTIGDTKDDTVLISDQHGFTRSHQPNEYQAMPSSRTQAASVKFNRNYKILKAVYKDRNGGVEVKPENVELNGVQIFKNLSDREKQTINLSLQEIKRSAGGDLHLIPTAHSIAEKLGCKTSDELMSVVQIVTKHVGGKEKAETSDALKSLQSGPVREKFIRDIQSDLEKANDCARRGGLNFRDPLIAVYHYRKHGDDFPSEIKKFGNTFEVYVGPVKDKVFDSKNLSEVCTLSDGTVRYFYVSNQDEFGVITSVPDGPKISTMFRQPGAKADSTKKLAEFFKDHESQGPPEPVSDAAARLARFLGFHGFHVIISVNGMKKPFKEWHDLDPRVHEEIALFLNSVTVD